MPTYVYIYTYILIYLYTYVYIYIYIYIYNVALSVFLRCVPGMDYAILTMSSNSRSTKVYHE